jgi:hypothetical protein
MALSSDSNDLARELRMSQELMARNKPAWEELMRAYHGRAWDGATQEGREPQYQTHVYEYVSLMMPKLVHQSPRFNLSTTRGGRQAVITKGLERGLNHWATASKLHEPLEAIALDALFMYGGGYIEEVPNDRMRLTDEQRSNIRGALRRPKSIAVTAPEDAEKPFWPRLRRLVPFEWGWDAFATTEEGVRFWWHKVTEDKDDLLRRAKGDTDDWLLDAIESLVPTKDARETTSKSEAPDRKQVTYYIMWVPDGQLDEDPKEDEHGVIYTLACETRADTHKVHGAFIRKPYYFYGPPQGPYVKAGFYSVPSSTIPLSPLMATHDQSVILTRVRRANVRGIEKYRRKVLYDLKDKKDLERIEGPDAKDLDLVGVTGFDGNAASFELGGMSDKGLEHEMYLRDILQTSSGMDDVQRGNVTGAGTATEVAIASEGSQERVSFINGKWKAFVADVGQRVGYYGGHDDRVVFSYKIEEEQREAIATEMMETQNPDGTPMLDQQGAEALMRYGALTFFGGDFDSESEGSDDLLFGDLDFDVEPYSMQRRDQRARKMDTLEALNVLSTFGAAAMQGVPIDFGKIAEILADVYALPELEDVVNRQLAQDQGILSMQEREAAMEKDTAAGEAGGPAKPVRSERAGPPKSAPRQMQKGLM